MRPPDRSWLQERLDGCYDIIDPGGYDDDSLAAVIKEADVAVGGTMAPKVLANARRLRYLQTPGTGVERLDLAALAARGVTVCKSTSHAPQVAEHAVALLLALMRKVALHDRLLRQSVWYRPQGGEDDELYQTDALSGSTIGLVGYGSINRTVAKMLAGFEVKFLLHARSAHPGMETVSLPRMFGEAKAVVIAVPLTDRTRGMIGEGVLEAGKPGPYLVNVGRAEVIDRAALVDALSRRTIRGAALDVPYSGLDAPDGLAEFARMDNALVSPHRAGTVRGHSPNLVDVAENLIAFAKGLPLKNRVDSQAGY